MPKKEKLGRVVSNKMNGTAVVEVSEYNPHPIYKKIIATTKNYMVNDPTNLCNENDEVRIIESKPISKTKRWTVVEIVRKAT